MKSIMIALGVTLGGAGAALAQDVVKLRTGSEVKGKISVLNSKNINIAEPGGKSTPLKAEEVATVTLGGDVPPSLQKADAAVAEGRIERALNLYPAAIEEINQKKSRDLHKQFVYMSWAMALQQKGSPAEALEMLRKLRSESGADCFLRPLSFDRSLEIARPKGDEMVEAVLNEMKGEPDPVGSKAQLEIARMKYSKGAYEEALGLYSKLATQAGSAYANDARLAVLRCLRLLKKQDELEGQCKQILSDRVSNGPSLLQAAGAALASIQLPKVEKDPAKTRELLMSCIQAIALGPPPSTSKEEGEDYALALLTASKCYSILSKGMAKQEAKDEYRNRAVSYLKEVRSFYKGTAMGEQAQKDLIAIGEEKPKDAPPNK
jgi:tetratricopeptide (TPR) repeat protein